MSKTTLILDAHWRQIDELFSRQTLEALHDQFDVVWGKDAPIPADLLADALPKAFAYVAAEPQVSAETLAKAPNLKLVAEVSGHFPDTIDYAACQARDIEVLSCAPGFRQSVAEMGVAMALSLGRGLIREHEAFRRGDERWLDDCAGEDMTLFGAPIGFVGYGSIAREVHRLLAPFDPKVSVYDPWLPEDRAREAGVTLMGLDDLMTQSRCLFIAAAPTRDNLHLIDGPLLAKLPQNATVVLISRAHLVDFDALLAAAEAGHIKAAIDVFPDEPVPANHPMRRCPNTVFSPHRAAAVEGGRQLIGDLLLRDLQLVLDGKTPRHFNRAATLDVAALAGVGDARAVEELAANRS
ncbi:MAG: hydroxyacid dehydrogenase [Rhizobiales bacterium]|nr:hydroxyacid dehydrogenase [Hyphomicrobiales bacterium]MBO6699537.1 hydroxyacid dehydrogenase [Hyphomicrobiales bacterium]MBO6737075.1 hydroxyacid dehydrogenase [Hyphomicrobiales bacterium]MBO6911851.1 hydroxyacid dehydrogenase [Hyphomicrobiales bacterium]MBO6954788.1 hydroxyacid dehydrogenase [Hyphomicrobiales bacterium]